MKSDKSLDELVDGIDLPNKQHAEWTWYKSLSRERLIFYAGKLRGLGMGDADVAGLISDLYWDSYIECRGNGVFANGEIQRS